MKILKKNIFILFFLLFFTGIFNYYFDPGQKFKNYVLKEDGNVLVLQNIDERLLKSNFIEKDKNKKEIIILGSSRSMTIDLNNEKVINLAVSGANLKDDLALLYRYINVNKCLPKKIILGIDPWVFNKIEDTRYKVLEKDYLNMLFLLNKKNNKSNKDNKNIEKIKYLFKISTLKDSLKLYKKRGLKKIDSLKIIKEEIDENGNIYKSKTRALQYSNLFIKNKNINWRSHLNYQLLGFKELNKETQEIFEEFLYWSKQNKICVLIYLPPYNPLYYKEYILNSNYHSLFQEIESYIKKMSDIYDIKIIGKYYIEKLKNEDFYDGIHMRAEKIEEYFEFKKL